MSGVFVVLMSISEETIVGYKYKVIHWTSLDDLEGGGQTILIIVVLFHLEIHAVVKTNRYNSPIRE